MQLMNFSPLAKMVLARTTLIGAVIARTILHDFKRNALSFGPMASSALPINATNLNPKLLGEESGLEIVFFKPNGNNGYVDIALHGQDGSYRRQTFCSYLDMPKTMVHAYKGKNLSELVNVPGFNTMVIEKVAETHGRSMNGLWQRGTEFTASTPKLEELDISAICGNVAAEDFQGDYWDNLNQKTRNILELAEATIPNIRNMINPVLKYVQDSRKDSVRLTQNWSVVSQTKLKFMNDKTPGLRSAEAQQSAASELCAEIIAATLN